MKRICFLLAAGALALTLTACDGSASSIGCSATSTSSWCKLFTHH